MRCATLTPLRAVVSGLVAGAAGTIAMDLVWFARYKKGQGKDGFWAWEFSAGLDNWDDASAPAQVGKRFAEGFLQRQLPPERARLVNNVVHWTYGMAWGGLYGIVAGSARSPRVRYGLALGSIVWGTAYVVLPAAGIYKPIWEYDARTLAEDLSAHLVYGLGTAAAFRGSPAADDRSGVRDAPPRPRISQRFERPRPGR